MHVALVSCSPRYTQKKRLVVLDVYGLTIIREWWYHDCIYIWGYNTPSLFCYGRKYWEMGSKFWPLSCFTQIPFLPSMWHWIFPEFQLNLKFVFKVALTKKRIFKFDLTRLSEFIEVICLWSMVIQAHVIWIRMLS